MSPLKNKVGILTFQHAENSGASLQAYALQESLKSYFDQSKVEHINYVNDKIQNKSVVLKQKNIKDMLALAVKKVIYHSRIKKRTEKFSSFDDKYLELTKVYTQNNIDDLKYEYSAVVVGSDQVFNVQITDLDRTFLLNFVSPSTKKFSYAASFGDVSFFKNNREYFNNELKGFEQLTFREKDATDSVSEALSDTSIQTVLDPTLLHTRSFWEEKFPEVIRSPRENGYILVYSVNPSQKLIDYAIKVAKDSGLNVIYLNTGLRSVQGVENVFDFGPIDFMRFIRNADKVVITSFHGLAFSIIFQKQFAVELFEKKSSGSSRLEALMERLDINDRNIVHNSNVFNEVVDYSEVTKKMATYQSEVNEVLTGWTNIINK